MRSAYLTVLLVSASLAGAAPMIPGSPLNSLSTPAAPLLKPLSDSLSTSPPPALSALTNDRQDLRGPPGGHSASILRKRQLALGSILTEGEKALANDQKTVPAAGAVPSSPQISPEASAAIYQAFDELRNLQQLPAASAISSAGSEPFSDTRNLFAGPLADTALAKGPLRMDREPIAGGLFAALGSDVLGRRVVKRGWNMYIEEREILGHQWAGAEEMDDVDDEPFWG